MPFISPWLRLKGLGMLGFRDNPQFFGALASPEVLVNHPGWHKMVGLAVDKEGWTVVMMQGVNRAALAEEEAISEAVNQTQHLNQWEARDSWQMIKVARLILNLVIEGGIATVFNNHFDLLW